MGGNRANPKDLDRIKGKSGLAPSPEADERAELENEAFRLEGLEGVLSSQLCECGEDRKALNKKLTKVSASLARSSEKKASLERDLKAQSKDKGLTAGANALGTLFVCVGQYLSGTIGITLFWVGFGLMLGSLALSLYFSMMRD